MKKLVSWIDIPSTDFKRAVNFYNTILEIELQVIDCGEEKMACFPSGEGSVYFSADSKPSKDGVIVSLNTEDDMDNTIKRIENNGGTITQAKTKIEAEGRGYFALFTDSEGNGLGLYGN